MRLLRRKDLQAERDVHRAEVLLATLRGLPQKDACEALSNHALLLGISLHGAALGVLATTPSEPMTDDVQSVGEGDARRATSPGIDAVVENSRPNQTRRNFPPGHETD